MTHQEKRAAALVKNSAPKYVRIYDNGGTTFDRYTCVFTGHWSGRAVYRSHYRGMSENPYHPQGYGMWGECEGHIDRPSYSHLGKPVRFADLPPMCQRLVISDYCDLWQISPELFTEKK